MTDVRSVPVQRLRPVDDHTMNAVMVHTYGQPLQLTRVPLPTLESGHALIRVEASGVNPLDTKIRIGAAAHARTTLPAILGIDLAGVVEAVADDVTDFVAGDAVYGMTGGVGGVPGSLADYALADVRLLAKRPVSWTAKQAAAVPLAAITSWEGLVERAGIRSGETVLIHGGAGGVGHIAVQLAISRGAEVYATGRAESFTILRALGATPIDYHLEDPTAYVQRCTDGVGFDVVFDTVGGGTLDASFESVRLYTGRVVSILGWGRHDLAPLSFRGASYSGVFSLLPLITGGGRRRHGDILRQVTTLAETGALTPLVDPRTFTLHTVGDAYRAVEEGTAQGKIVVDVRSAVDDSETPPHHQTRSPS